MTKIERLKALIEAQDNAAKEHPRLCGHDWQWGLWADANIVMHDGADGGAIARTEHPTIGTAIITAHNARATLKLLLRLWETAREVKLAREGIPAMGVERTRALSELDTALLEFDYAVNQLEGE